MSRVSVMRLLRVKYGITTKELADMVDVSQQYISDLELGKFSGRYNYQKSGEPLILQAFECVIADRVAQLCNLSEDIYKNRHRLLETVEDDYEL